VAARIDWCVAGKCYAWSRIHPSRDSMERFLDWRPNYAMIQFTPAQRNAIGLHALDQHACVVAGPGSGKTTVLIERFRALVESGVSPLRILAITFTEKATNQIRERLTRSFADHPDLADLIPKAYA